MKPTITLPAGLARLMMQSAYWPAAQGDLTEALGPDVTADLVERRQIAADQWFVQVAEGAGLSLPTSEAMLEEALSAWALGSRPGGAA